MSNQGKNSENRSKKTRVVTRETVGMVLALFSVIALVFLISQDAIFGEVGGAVSAFLLGVFGYGAFAVFALLIYASVALISGKYVHTGFKTALLIVLAALFAFCLAHTATAAVHGIAYDGFGNYLEACFRAGENGFAGATAGGAVTAIAVYPVVWLTTDIGGYIIFSLLIVGMVYLLVTVRRSAPRGKSRSVNPSGKPRRSEKPAQPKQRAAAAPQQAQAKAQFEGQGAFGQPQFEGQSAFEQPAQPQQGMPFAADERRQAEANVHLVNDGGRRQDASAYYPPQWQQGQQGQAQQWGTGRLYAGDGAFGMKSKREMRRDARREREEEKRARELEQQELLEHGHDILYPNRPKPAQQQPPQQAAAKKAVPKPAHGSYINNRIFDESSYFNNPARSISREQYTENFRGKSSILEGHELSSPRSPVPQPQQPQAEETKKKDEPVKYSQLYENGAEGNVTFTDRPKRIVPDRPAQPEQPDVPVSTYQANGASFKKDDGNADAGFDINRPLSAFMNDPFAQGDRGISAHDVQLHSHDEPGSLDIGDTARRAGLGGAASRRGTGAAASSSARAEERGSLFPDEPTRYDLPPRSERMQDMPLFTDLPPRAKDEPSLFTGEDFGGTGRASSRDLGAGRGGLGADLDGLSADLSRNGFGQSADRNDLSRGADLSRGGDMNRSGLGREGDLSRGDMNRNAPDRGADLSRGAGTEQNGGRGNEFGLNTDLTRGLDLSKPADAAEYGAEHPAARYADDTQERLSRFPSEDGIIIGDSHAAPAQPEEEPFGSAANLFDEPADLPAEQPAEPAPVQRAPRAQEPRKRHRYKRYKAPQLTLLNDYSNTSGFGEDEVEFNKQTIVETLSNLKIPCEVIGVTHGPAVTRYDIDIPGNIQASRVLGCDREIAMRLHAKDGVNIQTNYENGSISIEVPNMRRETVGLKEMLLSPEFTGAKPGSLAFGMGKDIEGRAVCGDITKMKHLLVAGATGSGKSVCLTAMIVSLLFKYSPEELRLILVDPKQTEFNVYEKLPHLMINEIITESAKAITALDWAINEMERRYTLFKEKTRQGTMVREIDGYNASLQIDEEKLPRIVIIMDEVADLMSVAKKDLEDRVQRLTQKSRAAGIHLVLATQRPSTDVITGIIKANLPTRIACKVTQEVDSRTILDCSGAEKLLGKGDMLYKTDTMTFPRRLQGAWMDDAEVQRVVSYVKENNEAYFDDSVADFINNQRGGTGGVSDDEVEAVYIDALRYVVSIGTASISMIQRRCSVGYPKAGKIIEWMENMGYISAFEGAKSRKVLLSKEDFEAKYGDYGE